MSPGVNGAFLSRSNSSDRSGCVSSIPTIQDWTDGLLKHVEDEARFVVFTKLWAFSGANQTLPYDSVTQAAPTALS